MKNYLSKSISAISLSLIASVAIGQTGNTSYGIGAGRSITTGDYNVFVGDSAGASTTSGLYNVFIGEDAGYRNTSGRENTYVGRHAGRTNSTGQDNTIIGHEAGYNNTDTDVTIIGCRAGYNNTLGSDVVFIGEEAGLYNTTGDDNTFIGEDAGYNNTTASDNTFIGSTAGRTNTTGYRCTFVGAEAGYDNRSGHHNTALGDSAGIDNSTGNFNTFLGAASGAGSEYAGWVTFVGAYAGYDNNRTNNTGQAWHNTYVGAYCGFVNREGNYNTGIGSNSQLNDNTAYRNNFLGADQDVWDNDNIVFGYSAYCDGNRNFVAGNDAKNHNNNDVYLIGYQSYAGASADQGIGFGYMDTIDANRAISIGYDGYSNGVDGIGLGAKTRVTGDSTVAVGGEAEVSAPRSLALGFGSSVSGTNSIAIGYGAAVSSDNEVYLGNSGMTSIGGVVNWTATSDGRFKSNVKEDVGGLEFINSLRPVTYNLNGDKVDEFYGRSTEGKSYPKSTVYSGFIAQEVEAAAKANGYDFSGVKIPVDDSKEIYGLRYAEFVVPLVKATQELSAKVEAQESIIANQKRTLENYQEAFLQMQKQMEVLEAKMDAVQNSSNTTVSK